MSYGILGFYTLASIIMHYEMKFSINLYNFIRSTKIIIDNRNYYFSSVDNLGQSWRK